MSRVGPSARFAGLVAIVDDDASVRRALQRLLSSVGLDSVSHELGLDFLSSSELHDVDCLLLDLHLPGMRGDEVLEEIRVAASKLPVVLMTGRYEHGFAAKALAAGAGAFLRKPFGEDELFDAIHKATGQKVSL